jgi:hypothetical protein
LLEPVPFDLRLVEAAKVEVDPNALCELDEGDVVFQLIGQGDRDSVRSDI